ncbi:hypothetical protein [Arthrobacter psychrolactophilus]
METDSLFSWLFVAVCAAAILVRVLIERGHRGQKKHVFRFWQQVGLPMGTEEIHDSLRVRLQRSVNAAFVGGVLGALVAAAQLWVGQEPLLSFTFMWQAAIPAILIGATLCDVVVTVRDTLFGQRAGLPRMARAQAVTLGDYISRWRLYAAAVLVLLAVLLGAAAVIIALVKDDDLGPVLEGMSLPLLLTAVIICGVCAMAANKLLQQPQPVSDKLELAWDDAVRADTIRKLAQLATLTSWFALSAVGIGILGEFDRGQDIQMSVVIGQCIAMVGYSVIFMLFSYGNAHSFFRRRLWPEFTPYGLASEQGTLS